MSEMTANAPQRRRTAILVEGGIMIALSTVLSMIKFLQLPYDGSITLLSMFPVLIFAYRHGTKWGLLCGFAHSLLQLLLGLNALKGISAATLIGAIVLDYLLAFTVLGLCGLFRGRKNGFILGTIVCLVLRFLCHYVSGVILWGVWAPEGMSAYLYSLIYNGSYMGVELITHTIAAVIFSKTSALSKHLR